MWNALEILNYTTSFELRLRLGWRWEEEGVREVGVCEKRVVLGCVVEWYGGEDG